MADYQTIRCKLSDAVATITLNRPDKMNAFNQTMLAELTAAVEAAGGDDTVRVIILTGAGKAFSAGQDLSERAQKAGDGPPDLSASLKQGYNPLVRALREVDKPVICAVNGVAAGAGIGIAMACDIVVAARSARFVFAFSRLSLVPDSGGTWNLPRLVGRARATGLAMLAETIDAEQAEAWGLIWAAVDDADVQDEARSIAAKLASKPPIGLGLIKQAFNASDGNDLAGQLDLEAELQGRAGKTQDYGEAVAAFMEKRDPKFRGA